MNDVTLPKVQSVLEIICKRCNDSYFLDVRSGGVSVFNGKLTLTRSFYFAELTVGIVSKLFGCLTRVFSGFGNHFRLDGIQVGIVIRNLSLIIICNGYAFAEEFSLPVDQVVYSLTFDELTVTIDVTA